MSDKASVKAVVVDARVKMNDRTPGWRLGRIQAINERTGEAITILITRTEARVLHPDGTVEAVDG